MARAGLRQGQGLWDGGVPGHRRTLARRIPTNKITFFLDFFFQTNFLLLKIFFVSKNLNIKMFLDFSNQDEKVLKN